MPQSRDGLLVIFHGIRERFENSPTRGAIFTSVFSESSRHLNGPPVSLAAGGFHICHGMEKSPAGSGHFPGVREAELSRTLLESTWVRRAAELRDADGDEVAARSYLDDAERWIDRAVGLLDELEYPVPRA